MTARIAAAIALMLSVSAHADRLSLSWNHPMRHRQPAWRDGGRLPLEKYTMMRRSGAAHCLSAR